MSATLEEIKFAKALVNPDKSVRDATIASLRNVITSCKTIDEMQMLKLWKALFYCMWLADMNPVQMELATNVAEMLKLFPKSNCALLYIRIFFRTIVREWHHLDQYRLNKFYSLIRAMLLRSFEYLVEKKWKSEITAQFLELLDTEVLKKVPNGVRYHIADIYLSEIWNATKGNISTEQFLYILQPFLNALSSADDKVFHGRIVKRVFESYLENHAAENTDKPHVFSKVSTKALQDALFETAAHNDTKESHRKSLYALHKGYQLALGSNIVVKESIALSASSGDQDVSSKKKKKKAANNMPAVIEAPAPAPEEPTPAPRKRKMSMEEEQEILTASAKKVRFGKKQAKGIQPFLRG